MDWYLQIISSKSSNIYHYSSFAHNCVRRDGVRQTDSPDEHLANCWTELFHCRITDAFGLDLEQLAKVQEQAEDRTRRGRGPIEVIVANFLSTVVGSIVHPAPANFDARGRDVDSSGYVGEVIRTWHRGNREMKSQNALAARSVKAAARRSRLKGFWR